MSHSDDSGSQRPTLHPAPNGNGDAVVVTRTFNLKQLLNLQVPPRQFILEPILRQREAAMIYAWRGAGKTQLGLSLAYAIASGGTILRWRAPRPRRVVYVDGEMALGTMQERLRQIQAGAGAAVSDPELFKLWTPDAQDVAVPDLSRPQGQQVFDDHVLKDAEVVFFDSISTLFRSGRENGAESWLPAQDWLLRLRRRGVGVVFVHHEGKNGAQRGTSRREDVLDTVIHLVKPKDYQVDDGARFEIHFEKYRNLCGADLTPFDARLEILDGKTRWTMREIGTDELAGVVELFEQGRSYRDIAKQTGVPRSTVARLHKKWQQGLQ